MSAELEATVLVDGVEGKINLHLERGGIRIKNDHGVVVLALPDFDEIAKHGERFKLALLQFEGDK